MKPEKPNVQFERDKLVEAVLYICTHADAEQFGNVHLHKTLYFADMLSYLATGRPITGVQYLKQQFGPVARHLSWALNNLAGRGDIKIENTDYYGYCKKKYVPLTDFTRNRLSLDDIRLLDDTIKYIGGKSARELSEFSHNEAWHNAEMGEEIPYHSVYRWLPSDVNQDDVNWAAEVIRSNAFERP